MTLLPIVTDWIAVLVVTDNCTRQCLGLPLFVAGSHVTSEMVALALRTLLPADLQFLISDRILRAGINCGFKERETKDLVRCGHDQTI
jgi:hypothetical protein